MYGLPSDVVELARLRVGVRRLLGPWRGVHATPAELDRVIEGIPPAGREEILRRVAMREGVRLVHHKGLVIPARDG
jgi:hypothetical protein